jgi:hypothetical protein
MAHFLKMPEFEKFILHADNLVSERGKKVYCPFRQAFFRLAGKSQNPVFYLFGKILRLSDGVGS